VRIVQAHFYLPDREQAQRLLLKVGFLLVTNGRHLRDGIERINKITE
jgi:hypothetical protein